MSYKFLAQSLSQGRYEPEGIYLSLPLHGECHVIQAWGEHEAYYGTFHYNGVPLKGHNGVDLAAEGATPVFVVDRGRVMGIGVELAGYGQYLKVEHTWGESFYAHIGKIVVDAGQALERGMQVATVALPSTSANRSNHSFLHFGIRTRPYNRFDGWGGFVDPIPFLDPTNLFFELPELRPKQEQLLPPHPMMDEGPHSRRP
jgi:murein DD-endopeptidase MepM/ murein hydrolase activator NlpD